MTCKIIRNEDSTIDHVIKEDGSRSSLFDHLVRRINMTPNLVEETKLAIGKDTVNRQDAALMLYAEVTSKEFNNIFESGELGNNEHFLVNGEPNPIYVDRYFGFIVNNRLVDTTSKKELRKLTNSSNLMKREVANILSNMERSVPIKYISRYEADKKGMRLGIKGAYSPVNDTIYLIKGQNNYEDTIFHEMIHAATTSYLNTNMEARAKMLELLNEVKEGVSKLGYEPSTMQALSNIDEFLVGILTDQRLANLINSIPGKRKTLWNRVLDFINSIFNNQGLDKSYNDALKEVLDITNRAVGNFVPTYKSKEFLYSQNLTDTEIQNLINNIELNSSNLELNSTNKDLYIDKSGNLFLRVSNKMKQIIPSPFMNSKNGERARSFGTQIDAIPDLVYEGKSLEEVKSEVRKLTFQDSKATLHSRYPVPDSVIEENYRRFTEFFQSRPNSKFLFQVRLSDMDAKIAGTADIVEVTETGQVNIFDVKTSRFPFKGKYYENYKGRNYGPATGHAMQLSLYAYMFHKTYGMQVSNIGVIGVHLNMKKDGKKYTGEIVSSNYNDNIRADYQSQLVAMAVSKPAVDESGNINTEASEHSALVDRIKQVLYKRTQNLISSVARSGQDTEYTQLKEKQKLEIALERLKGVDAVESVLRFIESSNAQVKVVAEQMERGAKALSQGKNVLESMHVVNYLAETLQSYQDILIDIENSLKLDGQKGYAARHDVDSPFALVNESLNIIRTELNRYSDVTKPLIANTLSKEAGDDTKYNAEIKDRIQRVNKQLQVLNKELQVAESEYSIKPTNKLQSKIKNLKGRIKYQEKRREAVLAVEQNENIILDLLNKLPKDITSITKLLTPAISTTDKALSLFAKFVKNQLERVRINALDKGREIGKAVEAYKKATKLSGNNPAEFNKGLYKTITVVKGVQTEDGTYQVYESDEIHIVDRFDSATHFAKRKAFYEQYNNLILNGDINGARELRNSFVGSNYSVVQNSEEVLDRYIKLVDDGVWTEQEFVEWASRVADVNSLTQDNEGAYQDAINKIQSGQYRLTLGNPFLEPIMEESTEWKELYNEDGTAKNPKGKFHKILYDIYMQAQEMVPKHKRSGTRIPSIRKSNYDTVVEAKSFMDGGKTLFKNMAAESIFVSPEDVERYGEDGTIPVMFSWSMPSSEVSLDLASSIFKYYDQAMRHNILSEIEPTAKATLKAFASRQVESSGEVNKLASKLGINTKKTTKGIDSNSYALLESFIDKVFYGKTQDKSKNTIITTPIGMVDLNKATDTLIRTAAFTQLGGWNPLLNMTNAIQGKIANAIERIGSPYYTKASRKWAELEFSRVARSLLEDFGKPYPQSFYGQLFGRYDPMQGEFQDKFGRNLTQSQIKRLMSTDTWFFGQHAGELWVSSTQWLAMMRATKVLDATGQETTLDRAYTLNKDGDLVIKEGYKGINGESIELVEQTTRNRVHGVNKELQGVYNDIDSPDLKKFWYGRLLLMYRSFIEPGMRRRYGAYRVDQEIDDTREGFYSSFINMWREDKKELFKVINPFAKEGDYFTNLEKENARKAAAELALIGTLFVSAMLMANADWDDEPETAYVMYLTLRTQRELSFFSNPQSAMEIVSSPFVAFSIIKKAYKFIDSIMPWNITETYERDTGMWQKGDPKAIARFLQLLGVTGYSTNPEYAVEIMQKVGM